ncbi:hypothetical protein ACJMK2_009254 [Sinanodonta woodiana]|uniref:Uncharacterized protein n=1 Tax=Sinanodonta woodiana TaxID=1069815 RepID=A0ABD3VE14_SINWO
MTTQDFKTSAIPNGSFGQVKNSIRVVADRVEVIDQKVEAIDTGLRYVPTRVGEIETSLHASNKNMEEIKWRNDVHSAKIKSMQQEMEEMRLQNEALRHQMQEFRNIPVYQESPKGDYYPGSPRRDIRDGYQQDRSPRDDYYQGRDAGGQAQAQPKRDDIFNPKEPAVRYQNNETFRPAGYHGPNQKLVGDYKTSYKSHFVEPKTLMMNIGSKVMIYFLIPKLFYDCTLNWNHL